MSKNEQLDQALTGASVGATSTVVGRLLTAQEIDSVAGADGDSGNYAQGTGNYTQSTCGQHSQTSGNYTQSCAPPAEK